VTGLISRSHTPGGAAGRSGLIFVALDRFKPVNDTAGNGANRVGG